VSQPWYGGDSLTGIAVLQKQARVHPGAAGVSQPWYGGDSLTAIAVLQKQARVHPGAAGVSQPWRRETTVRGET
jgi:hypothetical protein